MEEEREGMNYGQWINLVNRNGDQLIDELQKYRQMYYLTVKKRIDDQLGLSYGLVPTDVLDHGWICFSTKQAYFTYQNRRVEFAHMLPALTAPTGPQRGYRTLIEALGEIMLSVKGVSESVWNCGNDHSIRLRHIDEGLNEGMEPIKRDLRGIRSSLALIAGAADSLARAQWTLVRLRENEITGETPGELTIDDMELSVRAYNCLDLAGLTTPEKICQKTKEDLYKFRNLGRSSMASIMHSLADYGMELKSSEGEKE